MNISWQQSIVLTLFVLAFAWMMIDQYYPNYRNYLIGLWYFYVNRKFDRPLNNHVHADLKRQLLQLEQEGVRKYEQRLVKMILDHAGRIKIKTTGKHNNKVRWRIYRKGKKVSNFR